MLILFNIAVTYDKKVFQIGELNPEQTESSHCQEMMAGSSFTDSDQEILRKRETGD